MAIADWQSDYNVPNLRSFVFVQIHAHLKFCEDKPGGVTHLILHQALGLPAKS